IAWTLPIGASRKSEGSRHDVVFLEHNHVLQTTPWSRPVFWHKMHVEQRVNAVWSKKRPPREKLLLQTLARKPRELPARAPWAAWSNPLQPAAHLAPDQRSRHDEKATPSKFLFNQRGGCALKGTSALSRGRSAARSAVGGSGNCQSAAPPRERIEHLPNVRVMNMLLLDNFEGAQDAHPLSLGIFHGAMRILDMARLVRRRGSPQAGAPYD